MKKVVLLFLIIALMLAAVGCGKRIDQSTPIGTAQTLVQALIDGDQKTLEKINKSNILMFPTHYLMSEFAPKFADKKLSDFSFKTDEKYGKVLIYENEEVKYSVNVKKIGDKYYFISF